MAFSGVAGPLRSEFPITSSTAALSTDFAAKITAGIGKHRAQLGLAVAIIAGVVFRLIWLEDIEYKADQVWTFVQLQAFWQTFDLPWLGMPSSAGIPNPGMALWVFIPISVFTPLDDPLAMTRAVELVNVAAILLLWLFVMRCVAEDEREPWLWSVAIVSVNPLSVLFSRCIWAPEILPLVMVGFLWGLWRRDQPAGAFTWGLIGAALGQIHMAGFFFAGAFFFAIMMRDRLSVRWGAWWTGSILGALPMIPWFIALTRHQGGVDAANLNNLLPHFVLHWFAMATGANLPYTLGRSFPDFAKQPVIGGVATYLTSALMGVVLAVFAVLIVRAGIRIAKEGMTAVARAMPLKSLTVLALGSAFLGYGVLLCLMLRPIYLQYFVMAFSLPALSLAWLARVGSAPVAKAVTTARALLCVLVVAQAGLSIAFLSYIHDREVIDGDYGVTYHVLPPDQK